MTFAQSVTTCFKKYATFSGRAKRSEYWWFVLFSYVGSLVISTVEGAINSSAPGEVALLSLAFMLGTFLPSLSVAVRRLHDKGRSGWWWWIWMVPIVGLIILIYWLATEGDPGPNEYDDASTPPSDGGSDNSGNSSIPSVKR